MVDFTELAHVTVEELKYSVFLFSLRWLSWICEELRSSAVETRKHLRLISQRNRPTELGGFFVPFLEWSNYISTSTSYFWITAFKHSSSFDFWYQIQPIRKQWKRYLIRNFFGCKPFVELIRKGKAEQLLTKIRSVNEERDSRSLKQQGPFLNAKNK